MKPPEPSENSKAVLAIQAAREKRETTLNLLSVRVEVVPEAVWELDWLEELNLAYNSLTSLPESIGRLKALRRLDLSGNELTTLPESLRSLSHLTSLELSGNVFTSVPSFLWQISSLEYLELDGNSLTAIPPDIVGLQNLKWINLTSTKLEDLPSALFSLRYLETLYLGYNDLKVLPDSIGELSNLQGLFLHNNAFAELPASVARLRRLKILTLGSNPWTQLPNLGALRELTRLNITNLGLETLAAWIFKLPNLENLELNGNKLTIIPEEIRDLQHLKTLAAVGNQLNTVPDVIGSAKALASLDLSHNQLTKLPNSITELPNLLSLDVSHNKLVRFPEGMSRLAALMRLQASHNNLRELPQELGQLAKLTSADCSNNPGLRFPPYDIAELGGTAVVRFLRSIQAGSEFVWESKMLLVGEGQAGKTWLFEALSGRLKGGLRKDDTGTIGIEIGTLELAHPDDSSIKMRLNTWDFAGQEINHATHQFFFSNRTLFLVVWSARSGTIAGKVAKWLTNVRDRAPEAKIILVATQWDSPHNEYAREELKKAFPQIVATVEVSSQTGEGIDRLRDLIAREATSLPMMGLPWPITWRQVAERLRLMRSQSPHTMLQSVLETLKDHGLDSDESSLLIRWLHELGEILHFADQPDLTDRIVLDPQWVTRHVGQVLASRIVEENKGFVTRDCLLDVWGQHDEAVRNFLLALMEAFDLAYRIPDDWQDRSLVVERLPEDAVDYSGLWDTKANQPELRLRLRLEALHPGIPTWFIARCHRFSQGLHWRRGVLFGDDRGSPRHLGLVIANEYERTVDFAVRGPFPFTFMPLLRDGFFATVERRYPGLKIEKKVPCPGHHRDGRQCTHEFTLDELEGLIAPLHPEDEVIQTWQCVQCRNKHRVQDLLCGIGFAPLSGQITLERLGEMIEAEGDKTRYHVSQGLSEMQAWLQMEFVRQWNAQQRIEEYSCPSVLSVYPLDQGSLIHSATLRVQLFCMHPSGWHSVGLDGRCDSAPVKEGILKAGAFFAKWARWLKPAIAVLGAAVPVVGGAAGIAGDAGKALKEELELTAKALELLEKLPENQVENSGPPLGDTKAPFEARVDDLKGLKTFLDSLDLPVIPYGGLKRVVTPEEHVLWLCPKHVGEFGR